MIAPVPNTKHCQVIQDDIAREAIQKVPLEEFIGIQVLIQLPEFFEGVWVEVEAIDDDEYTELVGVLDCGSLIGFSRTDIQQILITE